MPVFDAGEPVTTEQGWGCSCPAYRHGEPTPEQALAALGRSVTVTVENDDAHHMRAWTDPENVYEVGYGPGKHGWCKHILACLSNWLPWYHQLALGADDALKEIHQLRKENKALGRKITRLEKR